MKEAKVEQRPEARYIPRYRVVKTTLKLNAAVSASARWEATERYLDCVFVVCVDSPINCCILDRARDGWRLSDIWTYCTLQCLWFV
ncbi:hypothetical protein J6590_070627 [Homalodisca vitripennis]|nr:hypothetical protein J6590_070627 [Homalodisca vitripennis]